MRRIAITMLLASVLAGSVHAQVKNLTIMAPAAPGGGWDATARMMQQALQQSGTASPVKVINVAGAGGTIGLAQFVNNEKGKGDQLMAMGLIMVGAVLTNKSPVTLAAVTPIARLTGEYEVLVVPSASPYKTLADFMKGWKANPGMAIAGGSAGGTDHMLAGLLAKASGVDVAKLNYVPHSGGGESIASLIGNQVSAGVNGEVFRADARADDSSATVGGRRVPPSGSSEEAAWYVYDVTAEEFPWAYARGSPKRAIAAITSS